MAFELAHARHIQKIIHNMDHHATEVNNTVDHNDNKTLSFDGIAPRLAANGYQPVPIAPGEKFPGANNGIPMREWQKFRLDGQDLSPFNRCGTGLLCGPIVAPDIDVLHPEAAAALTALAERMLGAAPRRTGMAPKTLLIYRTARPFAKKFTRTFAIEGYGNKNRIEVLSQGQQAIVYAIHPDTKQPYRWDGGDPLTIPAVELIEITEEQVAAFLTAADAVLADYGTPLQAERKDDGLNIGKAGSLDIAEMIATIRAGGGGWEDNVTKLAGKLIREGLDIDMIVALLREQITLKDQKNVRTGKFWTEKNTEWSLRKIYKSLKAKEAREAEEPSAEPGPEPVEEPDPSEKAGKTPTISPTNLPEEFWNARPLFNEIRQYAWRHRASGDSTFYGCLVRSTAIVPPGTVMYSKEKPSPLNLFLALLGLPGEGKSVLDNVIKDILPVPDWGIKGYPVVESNGIGTGEGLIALYNKWDKNLDWYKINIMSSYISTKALSSTTLNSALVRP